MQVPRFLYRYETYAYTNPLSYIQCSQFNTVVLRLPVYEKHRVFNHFTRSNTMKFRCFES